MIFDRNEKKSVVALLGAGSMGTAIVRQIPFHRLEWLINLLTKVHKKL